MANKAFDAMNKAAGNEGYISGGAIAMSEYESNMTPHEQSSYESFIERHLRDAYMLDPLRGDLDYEHWLKTLRPDLVEARAEEIDSQGQWGGPPSKPYGEYEMAILRNASVLQKLAHLHTGRVEDLIEIAKSFPEDPDYDYGARYASLTEERSTSGGWIGDMSLRTSTFYSPELLESSTAQELMQRGAERRQSGQEYAKRLEEKY